MIRPYQDADKEAVLALCKEFWAASQDCEFDANHTSDKLDLFLSSGVCLVSDSDGVDGFILLVVSTMLCSGEKIAAEVAWFVRPDARNGSGLSLLKVAIDYCKIADIKKLSMMYMESSMPEKIAKIYGKMGFRLEETTYVRAF